MKLYEELIESNEFQAEKYLGPQIAIVEYKNEIFSENKCLSSLNTYLNNKMIWRLVILIRVKLSQLKTVQSSY